MSSQAIQAADITTAGASDTSDAHDRKSFSRMVAEDTLKSHGARVGLAWVGVIAFFAVFAPFLANSHPYLMKVAGKWSSPLMQHLTQTDVTLVMVFLAGVVLAFVRGLTWPQRIAILLWVAAVTLVLVWWRSVLDLPAGSRLWYALGAVPAVVVAVWVPLSLKVAQRVKFVMLGAMGLAGIALLIYPVSPPQSIVYSTYRELEQTGKLEKIYRAPIPYSWGDRQRDVRDARLQEPSRQHWMGTEGNGSDVLS